MTGKSLKLAEGRSLQLGKMRTPQGARDGLIDRGGVRCAAGVAPNLLMTEVPVLWVKRCGVSSRTVARR